jgi:hypothetical protein
MCGVCIADLSEEASLQALNATQEMTRRTQELGASDEDLMASVVGVLSNLLVKAESLRRDNNVRACSLPLVILLSQSTD